jgi:addiction module HigA family antidote
MTLSKRRSRATLAKAGITPVSPGAYLEQFVLPTRQMDLHQAAAAMAIPVATLSGIIRNQRPVDQLIAEKLAQFTKTSPRFWLNLQAAASGVDSGNPDQEDLARVDVERFVWYGTNRKPRVKKGTLTYSTSRDGTVHYGFCRVFVPKSHKIGSTGSSLLRRVWTGKDDRLRLKNCGEMTSSAYWQAIRVHLATVPTDKQIAVVFVHGYNVSFEESALRAAQIAVDLSIDGVMAFFSWPSRGRLHRYLADGESIQVSESAITNFLVDFATLSGAQSVHVIAHSMGNRAVVRALSRIAEAAQQRSNKPFEQIILAAADVDADLFVQLSSSFARVAARTTLYVSTRDIASWISELLHDYQRAGLIPPILIAPGVDTINVTNVDLGLLGHNYVAEARGVLMDIHQLIAHGTPPERRFGLRSSSNDGKPFWIIGP